MSFQLHVKGYRMVFSSKADKQLNKLERNIAQEISIKLKRLVEGDKNLDIKSLVGRKKQYRLRSGKYRVIFEVYRKEIVVYIIEVSHRKEAYRKRT